MLVLKASVCYVAQIFRYKLIQEGNNILIGRGNSTVLNYLPSIKSCILPFPVTSLKALLGKEMAVFTTSPSHPRTGSSATALSSKVWSEMWMSRPSRQEVCCESVRYHLKPHSYFCYKSKSMFSSETPLKAFFSFLLKRWTWKTNGCILLYFFF